MMGKPQFMAAIGEFQKVNARHVAPLLCRVGFGLLSRRARPRGLSVVHAPLHCRVLAVAVHTLTHVLRRPRAPVSPALQDPAAAKKKYEGSPQVMKFFTDFCGIMGEHLTGLQDQKDAEAKNGAGSGGGGDTGVDRQMITCVQSAQRVGVVLAPSPLCVARWV